MKKYLMNKNVVHNGKDYPNGSELKESDDGFKSLIAQGHATELKFADPVEVKAEESEEQSEPTFNKKGKK